MARGSFPLLAPLIAVAITACSDVSSGGPDAGFDATLVDAAVDAATPTWPFALPPKFPIPRLPVGERLTPELVELGRHLFYDKRLSGNGTQACASCHEQARAFSDGKVTPSGSTGTVLRRNSMSLTNAVYNPTQTWANPLANTLERQALVPLQGEHPVELGITGREQEILARLAADAKYPGLFAAAFPGLSPPYDFPQIVAALAAFERRLISGNSRVDRHRNGDTTALSMSERRGAVIFNTEELQCHHCHGGFNFTSAVDDASVEQATPRFFNTGLYNVDNGKYPSTDQGLWEFTFVDADRGRYRPPTLRNIGVTAPYMHDGSVATLAEVIDIYERGGRNIASGPNAGDGRLNPLKNGFVSGFILTPEERTDLLAFLLALTDDDFLQDPQLADPFVAR
jgi:cytochrome c peroxidase